LYWFPLLNALLNLVYVHEVLPTTKFVADEYTTLPLSTQLVPFQYVVLYVKFRIDISTDDMLAEYAAPVNGDTSVQLPKAIVIDEYALPSACDHKTVAGAVVSYMKYELRAESGTSINCGTLVSLDMLVIQ
jgi:hypothetical protein